MGRGRAAAGRTALEFPQIPDRPRRSVEGGFYLGSRAGRSAHYRRHRARNSAEKRLKIVAAPGQSLVRRPWRGVAHQLFDGGDRQRINSLDQLQEGAARQQLRLYKDASPAPNECRDRADASPARSSPDAFGDHIHSHVERQIHQRSRRWWWSCDRCRWHRQTCLVDLDDVDAKLERLRKTIHCGRCRRRRWRCARRDLAIRR